MRHTKPSGVTSVEARPPGTSLLSTIIHEGPFCRSQSTFLCHLPNLQETYDLIQTLRSTQTSWACTNDENVDGTKGGEIQSVFAPGQRAPEGGWKMRKETTYISGWLILPSRIS